MRVVRRCRERVDDFMATAFITPSRHATGVAPLPLTLFPLTFEIENVLDDKPVVTDADKLPTLFPQLVADISNLRKLARSQPEDSFYGFDFVFPECH